MTEEEWEEELQVIEQKRASHCVLYTYTNDVDWENEKREVPTHVKTVLGEKHQPLNIMVGIYDGHGAQLGEKSSLGVSYKVIQVLYR